MSYNITAMKVHSLHLELPLTFDFRQWVEGLPFYTEDGLENVGKRWILADEHIFLASNLAQGTWKLDLGGQTLRGIIDNDCLSLISLTWTGDGSGYYYSDILLPLFNQFKGSMDVLVIWEGGDTVQEVHIVDGQIEAKEIA